MLRTEVIGLRSRCSSGLGGRRVGLTVGGVTEVAWRRLLARVKPVRPAAQRGIVVGLFGCQVRLLQVFHVLPGEEVLLDDLLLQRKELRRAAGGRVAGVARLADGGLRIEVVGVVLVDRGLSGDLDGGHQFAGEADDSQAQRVVVVNDLGVDRPVGGQPGGRPAAAEMRVDGGVQVVTRHLEGRRGGRVGGLVHVLDVIRVGGVLDDHLRVHLDPVDHLGVRVQRVVLVGFQLGQHRRLPIGGPAMPLVPDQDEAIPLHSVIGADPYVGLAANLAVRDQRIRAVAAPAPPVPGADDVLALHGATDAQVGAQVLAVRVQHVHLAGLGAEQHQLLTEVVGALDFTGSQVGSEGDDEPPRREAVLRQRNARTELLV